MKNIKGITLVSLVITIVIMLILAGVTISLVIGNNGLFNKSKVAASKYNDKALIEQIENIWNEYVTDSTSKDANAPVTLDGFKTYVTDNNLLDVADATDDSLKIKLDNNFFSVIMSGDGIGVTNAGMTENIPEEPETPVDDKEYAFSEKDAAEKMDFDNPTLYSGSEKQYVRISDNAIEFTCTNNSNGSSQAILIGSKNTYDLTSYSKIHFLYDIEPRINSSNSYSYICFRVCQRYPTNWNDIAFYNTSPSVMDNGDASSRTAQEAVLDVSSLSGNYYIFLQDCSIKCKIYKAWFE